MKKTILALGLAAALLGTASPALAEDDPELMHQTIKCMGAAIKECDADFPVSDYYSVAIRGWCYLIRTGICLAMET